MNETNINNIINIFEYINKSLVSLNKFLAEKNILIAKFQIDFANNSIFLEKRAN